MIARAEVMNRWRRRARGPRRPGDYRPELFMLVSSKRSRILENITQIEQKVFHYFQT